VQFSQDGHSLASASYDKTVRVYDLNKGTTIKAWTFPSFVSDLAFLTNEFLFQTNFGKLQLQSELNGSGVQKPSTSSLRFDRGWISEKDISVVWLPVDYRPLEGMVAIHGAILVFGHASGEVSFWEIGG
jgi:WD40 repeat protein